MDGGFQELDHGSPDDQRGFVRCDIGIPFKASEYACYKHFL